MALGYRGGDLQVELKDGDEPVTIADRAVSDLIVGGLQAAFENDVVISEENADDPRRLHAERVWFVDPIDGTREFIAGNNGFCILIGLAVNARPVLGAVYHPTSQELIVGANGAGAWLLPTGSDPVRLSTSTTSALADARIVMTTANKRQDREGDEPVLTITKFDRIGAIGLKLIVIAAGDRDVFMNPFSRSSAWDTCGPEAILAQAGGRITDLAGEPLIYDGENTRHQSGMIASNGHVHDAATERATQLRA